MKLILEFYVGSEYDGATCYAAFEAENKETATLELMELAEKCWKEWHSWNEKFKEITLPYRKALIQSRLKNTEKIDAEFDVQKAKLGECPSYNFSFYGHKLDHPIFVSNDGQVFEPTILTLEEFWERNLA